MLARLEGPDPPRKPWACDDTEAWLKTAFRAMPYTPIYAPRGNTLRSIDTNQPSATFDIVAFTGTVLGDRSEEEPPQPRWNRRAGLYMFPDPAEGSLVDGVWRVRRILMANGVRNGYRIGVRPDPRDRSRYLWTIHGIRNMFWEESRTAYASVEQALSEANARADQLD